MPETGTDAGLRAVTSVLMVSPFLPPHLGGVETYALNLAKELAAVHGVRVAVAATAAKDYDREVMERLFAGCDNMTLHWLPAATKISNTPLGLGWSRRLRQIARQEGVDVINAHAPVPLVADAAARACADLPFVLTYHSGPLAKGKPIVDAALAVYMHAVFRPTVRRADGLIYTSNYVKTHMPAIGSPVAGLIHPAVNPDLFYDGGPPADPARLLFVGTISRVTRYKGLAILIEAVRAGRRRGVNLTLEIVGDGDDRSTYEQLVSDAGIGGSVVFSGALSGPDLADAYRRCGVFVLPSTFDNFPTVTLEAMSCARPVVASDVGALGDVVQHGHSGYLVPPGDVAALTDRLCDLALSAERCEQMGANGRIFVLAQATLAAQARKTLDLYETVIRRQKSTTRRVAIVTARSAGGTSEMNNYARKVVNSVQGSVEHHAVVFATTELRRRFIEVEDGVTVIRLPAARFTGRLRIHPLWPLMLRNEFRRMHIDVVHAHGHVALPTMVDAAVRAAKGRRVVVTLHSTNVPSGPSLAAAVSALYRRTWLPAMLERCSAVGLTSPPADETAFPNFVLVPPGVDSTEFKPGFQECVDQARLLFVNGSGQESGWVGVEVLLQAVSLISDEIPGLGLTLLGSGEPVPRLQRYAASLGISKLLTWKAEVTGIKLLEEYQSARAVVGPAVSGQGYFHTELLQAMACGRAIVGSDVGSVAHVVRPGVDGTLVAPGEPRVLASALRAVLLDDQFATGLGAHGRQAVERYWEWSHRLKPIMEMIDGPSIHDRPA